MTAFNKHFSGRKTIARKVLAGLTALLLSCLILGCTNTSSLGSEDSGPVDSPENAVLEVSATSETSTTSETATATFAGGCFWCMEQPFDVLPGVTQTTSGYTGGSVENPTYYQVSDGDTGHFEAMQVQYDPTQVSYETLLDTFWHNIDPLDEQGQFCDKGSQYRSAIFYDTPEQQALAAQTKQTVANKFNQLIETDILPSAPFYSAEDYHQNYYQTRPLRYKVYRFGCGRDQRLSDLWGAEAPSHD